MSGEPETIEILLPNKLGYETLARDTVAWLGRRLGIEPERIADMQTAVCEACINAMEHGNQGVPDQRITVTFSYGPTHLDAVIADNGLQLYERSASAPATIQQKLAGLAPARGMGLMLIRQLVDEAEFLPAEHTQGNRYRIRLYHRVNKVRS